ncbi:tetratricopeptide repeat protein [Streptomyces sp. MUM 2J]|nr:tetratricopeptide repeat protein [Streptomyces sp. MUM 2J]
MRAMSPAYFYGFPKTRDTREAALHDRAEGGDRDALYVLVRLMYETGRVREAQKVVQEIGPEDQYAHQMVARDCWPWMPGYDSLVKLPVSASVSMSSLTRRFSSARVPSMFFGSSS